MVRATSDLGSHGKHVCVSLHKNYLLPATTQIRGHMVSAFLFPPPCPLPPVTHHDKLSPPLGIVLDPYTHNKTSSWGTWWYVLAILSTPQPLHPFPEHVCRRQPARMRSSLYIYVYFLLIFFFEICHIEFSVEAAISLNFYSFSILIELLENRFFQNIFSTFWKTDPDFVWKNLSCNYYRNTFISNAVYERLSRPVLIFSRFWDHLSWEKN